MNDIGNFYKRFGFKTIKVPRLIINIAVIERSIKGSEVTCYCNNMSVSYP